ncbi:HNH endonuclease [Dyella caseinilytica]|uniref:HNH endonuclease n=1 Tax=Dyella caseinilytica TaxID=1849581 RepID=A0ABX7GYV2_9GAMM|nr:HNH endonuclease [Dyella caseinilytica]QRN55577.1 HNH endonuclease [Dyella caseinilytica]GGA02821.1 hypothetical protein GCM10011408_25360 [Dyella caseinilytica]
MDKLPVYQCALCGESIAMENDSKEHIVPLAIGGRRKVRNFICRDCNNRAGHQWDAELAKQFSWFSAVLDIKRESGTPAPKVKITTIDQQEVYLHAGGRLELTKPTFEDVALPEGGRQISFRARTEREAKRILRGLQCKYPEHDFSSMAEGLVIESTTPGVFKAEFSFGGEFAGRSIVKTAIAMAHSIGIPQWQCDYAVRYLRNENATPAFGEFLARDLIVDRPDSKIFHVVAIAGDPVHKRLFAYVEYFGLARFVVHLSLDYSGDSIQQSYAFDPTTGEEIELQVDLISLSESEHSLVLNNEAASSFEARMAAFEYAMPIVFSVVRAKQNQQAIGQALEDACIELGLHPGQELDEKTAKQLAKCLTNKLMPHLLHRIRRRH